MSSLTFAAMHKDIPFPISETESSPVDVVGLLVINSRNLSSALCDAEHLCTLLLTRLCASRVVVLFDQQVAADHVASRLRVRNTLLGLGTKVTLEVCATKAVLQARIQEVCRSTISSQTTAVHVTPCRMIMVLSSHGYCAGHANYIHWNGLTITDSDLRTTLLGSLPTLTHCLALIDACQSGSFLNLSLQCEDPTTWTTHIENAVIDEHSENPNLVCIGAVSDMQYDQDDISEMGYGGGLTSAFIDYYMGIDQGPQGPQAVAARTIGGFFAYFHQRLRGVGNSPQISFNHASFLATNP